MASVTGRLASGLGEGASFTRLDWARRAFLDRVGIDPWPGTLNLALDDPAERAGWAHIAAGPALRIEPPDPAWCAARLFLVTIAGRIAGAVVLPEVPSYPADKIEVIAAVNVRAALGLRDGDAVTLTFAAG